MVNTRILITPNPPYSRVRLLRVPSIHKLVNVYEFLTQNSLTSNIHKFVGPSPYPNVTSHPTTLQPTPDMRGRCADVDIWFVCATWASHPGHPTFCSLTLQFPNHNHLDALYPTVSCSRIPLCFEQCIFIDIINFLLLS